MALLVKVNGTTEEVVVPEENALGVLQKAVGGHIEMVPVLDKATVKKGYIEAICDEEGKLKGKPINKLATQMTGRCGGHGFSDPIVGDCLFCKEGEVK